MNLNNKLAIAVTLALVGFAAHAQNKGMDIGFGPPAAPPGAVTAPVAAPAKPATAVAAPVAMPARVSAAAPVAAPARPAVVAKVVENKPVMENKPVVPRANPVAAPVAKRAAVQAPVAAKEVQPVAVAMAPAPRPAAAPIAVAQAPAAIDSDVNPFTGRDLNAEQRQRQLENAKSDTDLIQEKLKQANLIAELTYLPLKKRAEVASLPGIVAASTATSTPAGKAGNVAGGVDSQGVVAPVRKAVKKAPAKKQAPVVVAPAVPAAPTITVSGISINGKMASAIVEADGGVMSVQHGESTPFGELRVIDSRTITLGGRTLRVRDAMLSRMTVSDPDYVDPEKAKANAPAPVAAPAAILNLPPLPPLPQPPKGMNASMAPTPMR
jgi:hypothetical protein